MVGETKPFILDFGITNSGSDPAYDVQMSFDYNSQNMPETNWNGCKVVKGGSTGEGSGVSFVNSNLNLSEVNSTFFLDCTTRMSSRYHCSPSKDQSKVQISNFKELLAKF